MKAAHTSLPFALLLKIVLLVAVVAFIATACGSSVGAAPQTPTPAPLQKCGSINVMPSRIASAQNAAVNAGTGVAGNCFWQAFQQCKSASLTVSFGSVDTVTIHTFNVQKKDAGCTISDAVQHRVIPRPAGTIATYTCSGLAKVANELHFNSCGISGNVTVPMG